jgi:hypothetical protein
MKKCPDRNEVLDRMELVYSTSDNERESNENRAGSHQNIEKIDFEFVSDQYM